MAPDQLATIRIDGLDGVVLVSEYTHDEGVSRLFSTTVDVACEAGTVTFDRVAMRPARLTIRGAHSQRHVHGIVARWEYLRTGTHYTFYRATIVPRAHRLGLRQDMRIFQRRSTPEITREVLVAAGLQPDEFRIDVVRDHPQRDYCVQYRETDLDFVHRILAREGMFYFFEHGEDAGVLVIADHPKVHGPPPGLTERLRHDFGFATSHERLLAFRAGAQVRPGKLTLRDFDPLRPSLPVELDLAPGLDQDLEVYGFPGGFVEEGLPFIKLGGGAIGSMFGQLQAGRDQSEGESDCPALTAGATVDLGENPRPDLDGEYVVTDIVHTGKQPGVAQVDADEPSTYQNHFTCVPAGTPVPLPQSAARPQIPSLQTAIVVGPKDQPVYTDHLGRIKVQFHWDRQGQRDEASSCWIRVVHPWGGHQHGFLSTPRVGSEVAVAFLEGDPDRPLVLGCLYSEDNTHPHELPAAKTRTAWRSQSLPGTGFNELCFEDNGGGEQILLRAERDYSVRVQHDVKTTIDHCAHTTVKLTRATQVGTDHLRIDKHRVEEIGGDSITTVAGTLLLAAANLIVQIDQGAVLETRGALGISTQSTLTLTGSGGVCLKGPGGFITINDQGIYIEGSKIYLNSGGQSLPSQSPAVPQHNPPTTPTPADEP